LALLQQNHDSKYVDNLQTMAVLHQQLNTGCNSVAKTTGYCTV